MPNPVADQLDELHVEIGQIMYRLRTATGREKILLEERLTRVEDRKVALLNRNSYVHS